VQTISQLVTLTIPQPGLVRLLVSCVFLADYLVQILGALDGACLAVELSTKAFTAKFAPLIVD
jgi:hypothetical protein